MTAEAIKQSLSVTQLLDYYGAKAGKTKGQYHCIAHDDTNPSLIATDRNGRAHCMAAGCPIKNADIFDIIKVMENCNFKQAKIVAEDIFGSVRVTGGAYTLREVADELVPDSKKKKNDAIIPATFILKTLHKQWLKARFGEEWEWVVSYFKIKAWKNHLAVPIDEEGTSMVFIPLDKTKDSIFYKGRTRTVQVFPNKPKTHANATHIFVCEGEKDVMRVTLELHKQGLLGEWAVITNTNGANSIKEYTPLFETFDKDKVQVVVIAYDKDEAGDEASMRVLLNARNYFTANTKIKIFDKFPPNAPKGYDMTDYFNDKFAESQIPFTLASDGSYYPNDAQADVNDYLPTQPDYPAYTKKNQHVINRIIKTAAEIYTEEPREIDFLHTVFCQVGMPRKKTNERIFERKNGNASLLLEAGHLYHPKGGWVEQPLPYGVIPRLIMVHITGEAVRSNSPVIPVGETLTDFMRLLGIANSGGKQGRYASFKKQLHALAASRVTIGMAYESQSLTINTQPIKSFLAWSEDMQNAVMWQGVIELSNEFFENLREYAVPLDSRALAALQHSALSLDVYTWLANRLPRINQPAGIKLSWDKLYEQFGQEYTNISDFRREFKEALKQVKIVYKDAKIDELIDGRGYTRGFIFLHSQPPVPKLML